MWVQRKCGCVKATLPHSGKVAIRCPKHRGKKCKKGRLLCYFDEEGIVRTEK